MKRFARTIRSILYAMVFLLVAGLVILFFSKDSGVALKDILFWVGVAPIALSSIGRFGNFFGKTKSSEELTGSASDRGAKQYSGQDGDDQSRTGPAVTWIGAGLLVWLIAYFL